MEHHAGDVWEHVQGWEYVLESKHPIVPHWWRCKITKVPAHWNSHLNAIVDFDPHNASTNSNWKKKQSDDLDNWV